MHLRKNVLEIETTNRNIKSTAPNYNIQSTNQIYRIMDRSVSGNKYYIIYVQAV